MPLAVAVTEAVPAALVVALIVERVAPAPLAGALNVTTAPATALLFPSVTFTVSGCAKALPIAAV